MSDENPFTGWFVIETEFSQQLRAYQRARDGLVLSVERKTGPTSHSVVTLPANFYEDNQTISVVDDCDTESEAVRAAHDFMDDNPR